MLITTEICAKEYARLHYPKTTEGLNLLFAEGLSRFSDMSQFNDYYRKASLDTFSITYLVPMIVKKLKNKGAL